MKTATHRSLSCPAVRATWLAGVCIALATGSVHAQVAMESGIITRNSTGAVKGASPSVKLAQAGRSTASSSRQSAQRERSSGGPTCTGEAASPGNLLVPLGKSTLMRLPEPIASRTIGNPTIVQAMTVSPDTIYLLGLSVGTTNMIIQGRSGACTVVDVVVDMDPGGLEATLRKLLPEEKDITVTAAADTLILSGTVADATAVGRAVEIANAFVRRPAAAVPGGTPSPIPPGDETRGPAAQDNRQSYGMSGGGITTRGGTRVINLLNVSDPQQVMLEVKVAEVSKSLLDKLGVGTAVQKTSGSWAYTLLTNFLTGTANGIIDATKSNGNSVTLEAEKRDGLIRILAEPTLMAISGQEGRFLAGGTILIPVEQGRDGAIGLEEKDFGVKLSFTPTVLAGGRINLKVHPEVSELSREGVGITTVGVPGRAVLPLITKRDASTTVQLMDGQSFAIGGLIKHNSTANIKAMPVLGEIPVLGALFRSTDFQEDKTELLFVVTPRLVKPLPANYSLPTDNVTAPSRTELFLGGQLEGRRSEAQQGPGVAPVSGNVSPNPNGPSGFELK